MKIIFLFIFLFSSNVFSDESMCTKLICFSKTSFIDNKKFILSGATDFKYLLFNVYSAGLYFEEGSNKDDSLTPLSGNSSLSLILKYHRSINKDDFIKSTKAYLSKLKTYSNELDPKFEGLYNAYENVNKDDSYSLTYQAEGEKTCLKLNNIEKYCASGKAFFQAFAGIWLSKEGVGEEFLSNLIGS